MEGTLRPGDRIIAVNGKGLAGMKLPELQVSKSLSHWFLNGFLMTHSIDLEILMIMIFLMQALLYQQDNETVFTVEYDIAKQVRIINIDKQVIIAK